MAKYDQGGGCACGLNRVCNCGQGQADGTKIPLDAVVVKKLDLDDPKNTRITDLPWMEIVKNNIGLVRIMETYDIKDSDKFEFLKLYNTVIDVYYAGVKKGQNDIVQGILNR